MKRTLAPAVLVCLSFAQVAFAAPQPLIVHEWGTFTGLQDEHGNSIGAINTDDEPVPDFVHDIAGDLLIGDAKAQRAQEASIRFVKSFPRAHPDVTMRLETPVLYVHPGSTPPPKLDVSVEFRGGWLTQFYPDAQFNRPKSTAAPITRAVRSRLAWNDLKITEDQSKLPGTKEHVWLTPRNVKGAATLATPKGQTEKYLFYRGIGHLESPLRISREGGQFFFATNFDSDMPMDKPPTFSHVWLTTIRPDGSCAWRAIDPINLLSSKQSRAPATFAESDFSAQRLAELKTSMHAALVSSGLFDDEATAMLETWTLSYFKSPGTRVFYVVPPSWTEYVLPLTVSPRPDELRRVMIGRIDLVTPEQRGLLTQIAAAKDVKKQDQQLWDAYDRLGRFRNALVLSELAQRPTVGLKQFVTAHHLEGFSPAPKADSAVSAVPLKTAQEP
jgi:hypothetical protein